jgi:hypothetical protein
LAVGAAVFSIREAVSSVTNASLNEAVGVTVSATASKTDASGVCVGITGVDVGGMPPSGVGVRYCPHKEAFPPHAGAANKKDAAIIKLISRFTK